MSHLTLADFERRYQRERDPWGYETSAYEREKYDATLAACGSGPHHRALELGASIGVLSARLAPHCEHLTTIDGAPTAVDAARRRLADAPAVDVRLGAIPDDLPPGPWDLVLASEILYYLPAEGLIRTLARLGEDVRPGGRVVAVHWRPSGPERPFSADDVHRELRAQPWAIPVAETETADYLLDVVRRR